MFATRAGVLEATALFAAAPRPVLERLASETSEITATAGETLIHEGDRADSLVLHPSHRRRGRASRRARAGDARAGELVRRDRVAGERVPRTATVYAREECALLRIDGEAFLEALTTAPLSSTALEGARARYAAVRGHEQPQPVPG